MTGRGIILKHKLTWLWKPWPILYSSMLKGFTHGDFPVVCKKFPEDTTFYGWKKRNPAT